MWRGNGTSVLHRFPYSAINFYVYEHMLSLLQHGNIDQDDDDDDTNETSAQIARRLTHFREETPKQRRQETTASTKFIAGATAGSVAVVACYPLDLVRTRLTTELEGREHYRGMVDAFRKIYSQEGIMGYYSGLLPTLLVAVPNFAISYTVYGTLKEQALDDDLFYNLRQVDAESGEPKMGFALTLGCGAFSGALATLATFPMDTIRRRMQIQNLHLPPNERLTAVKHIQSMVTMEGTSRRYWVFVICGIVYCSSHSFLAIFNEQRIQEFISRINARIAQGDSHGWDTVFGIRKQQRNARCIMQ